ncbi:MAG TPA: hypothetical protein PLE42_00345, partial [Candidatus Competibacteraceae bacterium]|nr:hypothetical protein [Candidatus Competibacteraceae bacterium]
CVTTLQLVYRCHSYASLTAPPIPLRHRAPPAAGTACISSAQVARNSLPSARSFPDLDHEIL